MDFPIHPNSGHGMANGFGSIRVRCRNAGAPPLAAGLLVGFVHDRSGDFAVRSATLLLYEIYFEACE
jgi:hypothetical protein